MKPLANRDELIVIAKELRSHGLSYRKVADQLGVKSPQTIYEWLNPEKTKQSGARYRKKNKESIKIRQDKWAVDNREENLDRKAIYREEHREELREKNAIYYQENIESRRMYHKIYRIEHGDELREREAARRAKPENKAKKAADQKLYRENNKEKIALSDKIYRENNKDKIQAKDRAYRLSHKKEENEKVRRRRYIMQSCGDINTDQYAAILEEQKGMCFYCGKKMLMDGDSHSPDYWQVEHVNPISNGGMHQIENVVYACLSCNTSKGPKLVEDWMPEIMSKIYSHERLKYDIEENNKRWLI